MKKAIALLTFIAIFLLPSIILAIKPYDYFIEVNTDTSVYSLGHSVKIVGILTNHRDPVPNHIIGVQINTPVGIFYVNQVKTDSNGYFEDTFKLKANSLPGFYTVYVTSGNIIAEKTFQVVPNSKKLTIDLNKEKYSQGDPVAIAGTLYKQEPLQNKPIAVQVINPNYGPVFIDQTETDQNGNYHSGFILPQNCPTGIYKIFVASGGIYSTEYFMIE